MPPAAEARAPCARGAARHRLRAEPHARARERARAGGARAAEQPRRSRRAGRARRAAAAAHAGGRVRRSRRAPGAAEAAEACRRRPPSARWPDRLRGTSRWSHDRACRPPRPRERAATRRPPPRAATARTRGARRRPAPTAASAHTAISTGGSQLSWPTYSCSTASSVATPAASASGAKIRARSAAVDQLRDARAEQRGREGRQQRHVVGVEDAAGGAEQHGGRQERATDRQQPAAARVGAAQARGEQDRQAR